MSANPRIHRFDFGALRDFRGPIIAQALEEKAPISPPPPPPPVYSEHDLETARSAAKKQGFADGFLAGKQEAAQESDQKSEDANGAIRALADAISELKTRYEQLLANEAIYLSQITTSIARKVAAEALDERGIETISAIMARCLPVIFSKPKLMVDINPEIFERAVERLESQLQSSGFSGEIQFRLNPELGKSDIALDWVSGQLNRSEQMLWNEIETLMASVPLEITLPEITINSGE